MLHEDYHLSTKQCILLARVAISLTLWISLAREVHVTVLLQLRSWEVCSKFFFMQVTATVHVHVEPLP